MPVHLIVFQEGKRLGLDLKDGVYRVGREEPADIVIPDRTISSAHAELQVMGSSVLLRDLGSTNGTFVDDQPLRAARELKPSDRIRLGSVQISIEFHEEKKAPVRSTAPVVPGVKKQKEAIKAASGRIRWTVRFWLAGLYVVLFLLTLFLFVQMYYGSVTAKARLESRLQTLAAQYMHVLSQPDLKTVPPPAVDRWLSEPLMVLNREGRVVYPDTFGQEVKSPIVDPETGKVYDLAKNGLVKASIAGAKEGDRIQVRSYPVRNGGAIVGYVIARPAELGDEDLTRAIGMLAIAGLAGLVFLMFTLKPVTQMVRLQLQNLTEKVGPLANGFIEALPRSSTMPELSELAEEIEKGLRTQKGADSRAQAKGTSGQQELDGRLTDLLQAAQYPWCFLDNDFKIVMMSDELTRIRELSAMRVGRSIFDSSATSMQSKQLVQAMTTAKQDRKPVSMVLELERDGSPVPFRVTALAYSAEARGQLYGLMLAPGA